MLREPQGRAHSLARPLQGAQLCLHFSLFFLAEAPHPGTAIVPGQPGGLVTVQVRHSRPRRKRSSVPGSPLVLPFTVPFVGTAFAKGFANFHLWWLNGVSSTVCLRMNSVRIGCALSVARGCSARAPGAGGSGRMGFLHPAGGCLAFSSRVLHPDAQGCEMPPPPPPPPPSLPCAI